VPVLVLVPEAAPLPVAVALLVDIDTDTDMAGEAMVVDKSMERNAGGECTVESCPKAAHIVDPRPLVNSSVERIGSEVDISNANANANAIAPAGDDSCAERARHLRQTEPVWA
jgi:hypothetical protein